MYKGRVARLQAEPFQSMDDLGLIYGITQLSFPLLLVMTNIMRQSEFTSSLLNRQYENLAIWAHEVVEQHYGRVAGGILNIVYRMLL